jgi:cytochrome c biogenesis protein CcmG/thiol:disulfide interchange protein DsbE
LSLLRPHLMRRRLLRLAPLTAFALSASALWVLVEHLRAPPDETTPVGNPLIGRPVPQFSIAALGDGPGIRTQDFAGASGPVLLNFFASWCEPCVQEMPVLLGLREQGLAIWGIAYRDRPEAAKAFLTQRGDPYQRLGGDEDGATGPVFGLIGLPESFLISRSGAVVWCWAGGLSRDVVSQSLMPLL